VFTNLKKEIGDNPADLDGYEDLTEEDQQKIQTAWENGAVDDADSEHASIFASTLVNRCCSPRERQSRFWSRGRRRGRRQEKEGELSEHLRLLCMITFQ
jgi:hypothetical protein